MPLIHSKSKKALKKNIEMEMEEHPGKEHKAQDLAIAFSVQRQARKKKMAPMESDYMSSESPEKFAEGGIAGQDNEMSESDYEDGIADRIMRRRKMMADGGTVDIEENAEESGQSPYDGYNSDAYKKELYDDNMLDDQPLDSKGDKLDDEDKHDMIKQIRKRMRAKHGPKNKSPDDSELD